MDAIISIYLFIVGAALGSFALVLADRGHSGRDWVRGRSVCDHCGHQLAPVDLVPLLSWTMQRGRCRYCGKGLSAFYPLVELGLGTAFAFSYALVPYDLSGAGLVLFALWGLGLVIMTALFVTDVKWFLLPSKLVYPLSAVAALHWVVEVMAFGEVGLVAVAKLLGALAVGAGLFWVLHTVSHGRWIGDGDYRLGIAMGFFLGDATNDMDVAILCITFWVALCDANIDQNETKT